MVSPLNFRTPGVEPIRTCVWRVQFLRRETTWVQTMIYCRVRCLAQRCIRTTPRLIWTAKAVLRVMETRGTNPMPPTLVRTPHPPSSSFIQAWCTPRPQRTEVGRVEGGRGEQRGHRFQGHGEKKLGARQEWVHVLHAHMLTHSHEDRMERHNSRLSSGGRLHVYTEQTDAEVILPSLPISPFVHPSVKVKLVWNWFWNIHEHQLISALDAHTHTYTHMHC